MKKSLILATSFAMALGVGVAVGAHHAREVEVKAATETTVYYAVSSATVGSYSVKLNVNFKGDGEDWHQFDMSKETATFGGKDVYSGSYTDAYNGVGVMQFQLYDGLTWKSEEVAINSWTTVGNYNGKIWDGKWKTYTPDGGTSYKVDVYVDGVKRGNEDITEGDLPGEPAGQYGKYFSGWFDNAECSEGHEVTGVTSTDPVYCKHLSYPTTNYTYSLEKAEEGKFAEVYLYEFDDSGDKAAWPGTKLETTSFSVPTSATVILNAGDGKEQTINVEQLETPVANDVLEVLSTKTGDNYNARWASTVDEPAEDGYYLLGSKTSYKYAGAPKIPDLAEPDEDDNVAILEKYEAKEGEKYKVKYYNESEGKNQWSSTVAVEGLGTLDEDGNFVMSKDAFINIYVKWESSALKFYVAEYVEPVAPDVPAADGYYLLGSKTDYKYAGAPEVPELEEPDEDNNVAILLDYDAKEGEKYKVKYYNESEGKNDWGSTVAVEGLGTLDEDGNFVMSKDAHIDIFVKWEQVSEDPEVWAMKFYIAEHAERYNVTFKGLFYEGKDLEKTINVVDTQRATKDVNFEVKMDRLAQSGYVLRGVYTDNTFEHEYTATKLAGATELFVKYTKSGYYMTGDETFLGEGHGWNVDYSEMIEENATGNRFEGTITVPTGVDADHPMLVKPLHYEGQDNEGKTVWASAYYEMGINPDTEQKWEYSFASVDGDGNFKFVKPGTYAFYVYDTNKVTFNSGEYAFHAAFLSQVGGECKNDGSTDTAALKVIWGNMKTAYNALDKADRDAIYAVGFDGGDEDSGDDRLRMIAKYNYIVTKYGTAEFEDFIWGQTIAPKVGNNVMILKNSTNTGLIIIISVSAISVISIAAFLMLKKRKEK